MKSSQTQTEIPKVLSAWLGLADEHLANRNTAVADRILLSIFCLLEWKVLKTKAVSLFRMNRVR
jgi:hypothetical protein